MDANDALIHGLYRVAIEEEWRDYRSKALGKLCASFGAVSAAWWTRGEGTDSGELTQYPQPHLTTLMLSKLRFPDTSDHAVLELPGRHQKALAYFYPHWESTIVSTVVLHFATDSTLPATDALARVMAHMVEAGAVALRQFIRRDDWLAAMGRANRGAAAMVDAAGHVFASSERFREMLGEPEQGPSRLPFALPESVLGAEGGEFVHDPLHIRVRRTGELYLMYVRKPLPLDLLSPREQEIARALGNGKTLKSIARQYGIAVSTVANHTTRIYRKLAIYRREDLIDLVRVRPTPGRKPD